MKPGSLICLVICKWIELLFLTLLTAFLIAGCIQFIQKLNNEAAYLTVLSIIACIMAVMNLFYNNLLSNIRFHYKIHSYTFGTLIYDLPNLICCHNVLSKLCRDRWFTVPTAIKWSIKSIYLIILIALIKNYKIKFPSVTTFN